MEKDFFIVSESKSLEGTVEISGSKNAILPILCATILIDDDCIINNVVPYSDVIVLITILESLGKQIQYNVKKQSIKISGKVSKKYKLNEEMMSKLRASFLVTGPLIAKNKSATVPLPGGCQIGQRPVDLHLKGFNLLDISTDIKGGICVCKADDIIGNTIYLDFPSVGATENIIMASVFAKKETIIENPAFEPEIIDLCNFLNTAGANIEVLSEQIKITGVKKLHSLDYTVMPDRIEAGTFMVASAMTKGDITIKNIIPEHLKPITAKLKEMNVTVIEKENELRVIADKNISKTDIKTMPYPGFPTDLQSQFLTLLTKADGTSVVKESIFENRFMIAQELIKMGADIKVESDVSIINGVNKLQGAKVKATDLRGGVSLILAGLVAKGDTEISDIHHIERGYHDIENKLKKLGAKIKKVSPN